MGSRLSSVFRSSAAQSVRQVPVNRPAQPAAPRPNPKIHEPSTELLDRLKDVYVETTTDVVTQDNPYGSEQRSRDKLPQDRRAVYEDSYTLTQAPEGYLTFQQVMEVFDKKKTSQRTPDQLATDYKVDIIDLENLFKYFNSYRVIGKMDSTAPPMNLHPLIR